MAIEKRTCQDGWLTVDQSAVRASVCSGTIFAWIRAGMPIRKVRGRRLISTTALDRFVEELRWVPEDPSNVEQRVPQEGSRADE